MTVYKLNDLARRVKRIFEVDKENWWEKVFHGYDVRSPTQVPGSNTQHMLPIPASKTQTMGSSNLISSSWVLANNMENLNRTPIPKLQPWPLQTFKDSTECKTLVKLELKVIKT